MNQSLGLGLGLGLETLSLGLVLGLETQSLGLGLGLVDPSLDYITANVLHCENDRANCLRIIDLFPSMTLSKINMAVVLLPDALRMCAALQLQRQQWLKRSAVSALTDVSYSAPHTARVQGYLCKPERSA